MGEQAQRAEKGACGWFYPSRRSAPSLATAQRELSVSARFIVIPL